MQNETGHKASMWNCPTNIWIKNDVKWLEQVAEPLRFVWWAFGASVKKCVCVCVREHSLWNADLSQQGPEDKEQLVSAPPGQVTQSIFTFSPSSLIPSLLHSSPLAVFLVSLTFPVCNLSLSLWLRCHISILTHPFPAFYFPLHTHSFHPPHPWCSCFIADSQSQEEQ